MENLGKAEQFLTAREAGLVGCRTCGRVWPQGIHACARCGAGLQSRDLKSLQRVWAWLLAGLILYVPANLFPMLRTASLLETTENTILGGVIELVKHGNYGIAAIVFVASIVIPVGKFLAIALLAISLRSKTRLLEREAGTRLLHVVDFIGRWSMIDVFVVAILATLVQLGFVVSIKPGPAAAAFALSVVFTMLSAQSFDSRMIWDRLDEPRK